MTTKVQKWGNSLAVRISSGVAKRLGLKAGSRVLTRETAREIIIEPVRAEHEETLEELIAQITPENRYGKIDWGSRRGNEIW